jgi:hypothetical protein
VGESNHTDPLTAGREAAKTAWQQINNSPVALCLLFASSRYQSHHAAILSGAKSMIGDAPLIGCTTSGEITPTGPKRRSTVVLLIRRSEEWTVTTGFATGLDQNARQSGHELARLARASYEQAGGPPDRQLFLIFPDGLRGNGSDLLRGIQEIFGTGFPIIGGSAGDDFAFSQTFQFHSDRAITDSVVGALFGGNIVIGVGTRHGWKPLGKPRVVTSARSNMVIAIDQQPAARLYESYFGSEARNLLGDRLDRLTALYPLGIATDSEEGYLIRSALRLLPDGSLLCNAEVSPGSEVRLMMATRETVIEAARIAAQQAKDRLRGAKAFCAIVLASASRQQFLGRRASDELQAVRDVLGAETPTVGFYTYGEQSPMAMDRGQGTAHFHNESIVILALGAT